MAGREEIVEGLSRLALFADLSPAQLEGVVDEVTVSWFSEGDRILRQGLSGSAFYIVLDGECSVRVDGQERAKLGRGEFFGEISILLKTPPVADVVALTGMRCLVIDGTSAEHFFVMHPKVMLRMMRTLAMRLRDANRRRG